MCGTIPIRMQPHSDTYMTAYTYIS